MCEIPTPEATRRDGIPCRFIRLADGRAWGFARPTTRFVPIIVEEEDRPGRSSPRAAVHVDFGYPLEISRLVEATRVACEGIPAARQFEAFLSLSIALLRRVHEVERTTAHALLSVPDRELPGLVRDILEIISEEPSGPEYKHEVKHGID